MGAAAVEVALWRHSLDCLLSSAIAKSLLFLTQFSLTSTPSSLGKWQTAFSDTNTRKMDFHVTPKKTIQVPMMNREDWYFYILDQNIFCTVVGIPYQGSAIALFILPSEGKMKQVEDGLDERTLRNWLKMFTKRYSLCYLGATFFYPCQGDTLQDLTVLVEKTPSAVS